MGIRLPDRWLALGGTLVGLGGGAAIALALYSAEPGHPGFWRWPGYLSLGVCAIGVLLLAAGFFGSKPDRTPQQSQKSGDHSTNIQAGRDIRLDGEDD